MRFFFLVWIWICWLPVASAESAGEQGAERRSDPLRVLILYSNQRTLPANQEVQRGIWSTLEGGIHSRRLELFEEYLEVHRLPIGDEEPTMVSYLLKRYQNLPPEVVILVGSQALEFSDEWMSRIFPEALLAFSGVREDQIPEFSGRRPAAGVTYRLVVRPLLEIVSEMISGIREVVLVGGSAKFDRELLQVARGQIEEAFPWEISEISDETPEGVAQALSQLSPGTIVLFTSFFKDPEGGTHIPRKVLEEVSSDSAVPVFALFDTMLGSGATGIGSSTFFEQGKEVGRIVEALASGELPEAIGIAPVSAPRFLFDAREMKRYGLDPDRVPEGVEVFYDYPGLIESHPIAFAVGTVTIAVQSFLIVALLWTRHRKRRAESKAMAMERYFSTVFRENPNPMAVIGISDGAFQDINPAWEKLYGISREEALGRTPVEMGILSEEKDAGLYKDFLENAQVLSGYERQIHTGSGEVRNVAFYSNSVEIGGDRVHILTTVDTSDRIEAEKLRNSLSRGNRIAQLGQVSAWIAHEINQPLGSILSNAEAGLLLIARGGDCDQELREILSDIKSEDRRATRVVEHIRTMLGSHSVNREAVAIAEFLDEIFRMASPEASRRVVDLRYPAGEIPKISVVGDRVLLGQVLLNLIFNAMDAVADVPMSQRIVTLGCETSAAGEWVELSVSDRGPGVPPDRLSSIFEFFYSTKEEGMGLGLAISRFIVEDHKGSIHVVNKSGSGACFRVRLPIQESSQ